MVCVLRMVYVRGDVKTSAVVECRTGSGWILYKDELFGDIELWFRRVELGMLSLIPGMNQSLKSRQFLVA